MELKICMGTMCYVMGGAELCETVESLPDEIRSLLEVSYSPCLGKCNEKGEPPYIVLNGRTVARVSKAGLVQIIKEELRNAVR